MYFDIICFLAKLISIIFKILWICCSSLPSLISWLTLLFMLIFIISKFARLKRPNKKYVSNLIGDDYIDPDIINESTELFWPIAYQAAIYDAPENTLSAINKCISRSCKHILLDLSITKCGQLVCLHNSTVQRLNINKPVWEMDISEITSINVSEQHALGEQYPNQKVLTLNALLKYLEDNLSVTIFLLISRPRAKAIIDMIQNESKARDIYSKRIIYCCTSTMTIYQLRKSCPELICGLWIEKTKDAIKPKFLRSSSLLMSIYGAFLRNIITPVIGISVVFINKDEFNLQILSLWKNVGVRSIIYSVNSPNEKNYFQKVIKVQYVTDSLRSEPQVILKIR